jgi:hypothetical protein
MSLMHRGATDRGTVVETGEEISAALDAWRDAKRAYDDEAAPYVGVAWLPTVPALGPRGRLTQEACDKLTRLREAEQEAAEAFCAILVQNYTGGGSHRRSAG